MIKEYIKIILSVVLLLNVFQAESKNSNQPKNSALIDKVIVAYGGDNLINLKYLTYDYEWQLSWPGQGYDLSRTNFVTDKNKQYFNFEDKNSSTERWISQNGGVYHNRYLSIGSETFVLDYFTKQYSIDENQSFDTQFRLLSLYTDLYLAYAIATTPEKFTSAGKGVVEGRASDILMYQFNEKSKAMKVHIDSETGYILDTQRISGSGTVNRIIFESHIEKDGLLFAKENRVFNDGTLIYYSVDNNISTQAFSDNIFEIDEGFKKQDEMIESSEMKVQKIENNTYHVGFDGNFSAFFKNDKHLIGVNTYGGLKDKIAEVQKVEKAPLKYMVVTHHHSDHLDGIKDAIDAGVTLIMTEMTQIYLNDSTDHNMDDVKVIVVKDQLVLGEIQIYMVNTIHAAENLIVYHTKDNVLYQDDHYNAETKGKHTHINQSGLVLNQKLSGLNLDIDWILGGHAPKAEKWKDFQKAVNVNYIGNVCPSKRAICKDEQF